MHLLRQRVPWYHAGEGGIRGRAFITGGILPKIRRGKSFSGLISVADWLPTYAAIAGVPMAALSGIAAGPRPIDGMYLHL